MRASDVLTLFALSKATGPLITLRKQRSSSAPAAFRTIGFATDRMPGPLGAAVVLAPTTDRIHDRAVELTDRVVTLSQSLVT